MNSTLTTVCCAVALVGCANHSRQSAKSAATLNDQMMIANLNYAQRVEWDLMKLKIMRCFEQMQKLGPSAGAEFNQRMDSFLKEYQVELGAHDDKPWTPARASFYLNFTKTFAQRMETELMILKNTPSQVAAQSPAVSSTPSPKPVAQATESGTAGVQGRGIIESSRPGISSLEVGMERQFVLKSLGEPLLSSGSAQGESMEYGLMIPGNPKPLRFVVQLKSGQVASWGIKE